MLRGFAARVALIASPATIEIVILAAAFAAEKLVLARMVHAGLLAIQGSFEHALALYTPLVLLLL